MLLPLALPPPPPLPLLLPRMLRASSVLHCLAGRPHSPIRSPLNAHPALPGPRRSIQGDSKTSRYAQKLAWVNGRSWRGDRRIYVSRPVPASRWPALHALCSPQIGVRACCAALVPMAGLANPAFLVPACRR